MAGKSYRVLINSETVDRAIEYLEQLQAGGVPGRYLYLQLRDQDITKLSIDSFIQLLLNTKRPQIFAESAVYGDGRDWNQTELAILSDISIATPVTVYDNAKHRQPTVHPLPFSATLIFTPGALLRNGLGITPADWDAVTNSNLIDPAKYYQLYERRLLPAFVYVNEIAKSQDRMALITLPGIGCGQFAGIFKGQLGAKLRAVLVEFLQTYGARFSNIRAVYYDPYQECENERLEIEAISFFIRPLAQDNQAKPQLCQPNQYAEVGDDFTNCELFSFVAWDHVSWPGNDFYGGSRMTDDGVKAAATNVMMLMTGIEGHYNDRIYHYCPPSAYDTWAEVIVKNQIQLEINDDLMIYSA